MGKSKKIVIKVANDLEKVVRKIKKEHTLIFCNEKFYEYKDGCYQPSNTIQVEKTIREILKEGFCISRSREILHKLRVDAVIDPLDFNIPNVLNLKNGLLEVQNETAEEPYILYDHDSSCYSSIRLPVNYDKKAKCDLWLKTLKEIFIEDETKIQTLQEYFGLCLTSDTRYQKSLFLIGEGSNGKSKLLDILISMLGRDNCEAIRLENFNNRNHLACLFGKLVNISSECNTKSIIEDAMFKMIVSGDPITAERKYEHPFNFRPFCKLIFAVNNMPRVDDKTYAYFRRLLMLRFERKFIEGVDDNKNLFYELLVELDGIFMWALQGLISLRNRGYFTMDEIMAKEVAEYRRDNNNVILFVEENCSLSKDAKIAISILYTTYREWCRTNGYCPLSVIHFTKELRRQYSLADDKTSTHRLLVGITLK